MEGMTAAIHKNQTITILKKERKKERKKAINKERNLKKAKRKRLKDRDRTSNYYIAGNGSF